MADIELVVKIPEELKQAVDNNEEYRLYTESVGHVMLTAIKNGKPLEEVFDEIKAEVPKLVCCENEYRQALVKVADIIKCIDKYKPESEEGEKYADSN